MRHPLPYAYAKAHTLLLEDDGARMVLWAPETVGLPALSEVLRMYDVDAFEREPASTLAGRIAAAYAGGESSAACHDGSGALAPVPIRIDLPMECWLAATKARL